MTNKLTQQQKTSLAMSKLGLVNKKDICIKDYGSTFACVCDKCLAKSMEAINKLWK
tara:strand:- start:3327 stop:3494 length:168 start_codon:yes stop_codon:yes gene_type:complete